ncbi:Hypothetical predicted protein [Cloeon dipterum]|nr:Hypothetical predicted protein [Cloeon dipterum]
MSFPNLISCKSPTLRGNETNVNCGTTCFACTISSLDFDNCTAIEGTNTMLCACKHDQSVYSLRCTQNGSLADPKTGSHELGCRPEIRLRQSRPYAFGRFGDNNYTITSTDRPVPNWQTGNSVRMTKSSINPYMWAFIVVIIVATGFALVFAVMVCKSQREKYGVERLE